MAFEKYVAGCKAILESIEKNGPRDKNGELTLPFCTWAARLRHDIERAQEWEEVKAKKRANDVLSI